MLGFLQKNCQLGLLPASQFIICLLSLLISNSSPLLHLTVYLIVLFLQFLSQFLPHFLLKHKSTLLPRPCKQPLIFSNWPVIKEHQGFACIDGFFAITGHRSIESCILKRKDADESHLAQKLWVEEGIKSEVLISTKVQTCQWLW